MFNFWKKQKEYPEFWKMYLSHFKDKVPKRTPIDQLTFVVFDTETSGFNTKTDKLLTIGAVRVSGNKIDLKQNFEVRILQKEDYDTEAIPIHGISLTKKKVSLKQRLSNNSFITSRMILLLGRM